ncbi:MAG: hypothetical protein ACLTGI_05440 [Hoylesella buccalis]
MDKKDSFARNDAIFSVHCSIQYGAFVRHQLQATNISVAGISIPYLPVRLSFGAIQV